MPRATSHATLSEVAQDASRVAASPARSLGPRSSPKQSWSSAPRRDLSGHSSVTMQQPSVRSAASRAAGSSTAPKQRSTQQWSSDIMMPTSSSSALPNICASARLRLSRLSATGRTASPSLRLPESTSPKPPRPSNSSPMVSSAAGIKGTPGTNKATAFVCKAK